MFGVPADQPPEEVRVDVWFQPIRRRPARDGRHRVGWLYGLLPRTALAARGEWFGQGGFPSGAAFLLMTKNYEPKRSKFCVS